MSKRLTDEHPAKRVEDFRPIIERHAKYPGCDCAVCVAAALLAEVRASRAAPGEREERGATERDPHGIEFVEKLKREYESVSMPAAVNALERVLIVLRMRASRSEGTADTRGCPADPATPETGTRVLVGACPCGGKLVRFEGARTPEAQCLNCKVWRWPSSPSAPRPPGTAGHCSSCGPVSSDHHHCIVCEKPILDGEVWVTEVVNGWPWTLHRTCRDARAPAPAPAPTTPAPTGDEP